MPEVECRIENFSFRNQGEGKTHPVSWNVLNPAGSHLVHRHRAVPGSHSDTTGGETV